MKTYWYGIGGVVIAGLVACGSAGGGSTTPTPTATTTVTTTKPTTDPSAASGQITEGVWKVGTDITAGTYRTDTNVSGSTCYWQKSSDAEGTKILSNDLPTGGRPQVTLTKGQWFKTQGCGDWSRISK